ncbi:MAG: hypothetical protein KC547_14450 [Anaerolineae bacterium]|nr:hypothetical protein [Anaerolineae bacterium]
MFAASIIASGTGLSMVDVCLTPSSNQRLPLPYPTRANVVVIAISGPKAGKKVYKSKGDGTVSTLGDGSLSNAETFIIRPDGTVSGHPRPCRTPRAATALVSTELGAGATATVISSDDKDEYPIAFRVTPQTVRRVPIVSNPTDWMTAIRGH